MMMICLSVQIFEFLCGCGPAVYGVAMYVGCGGLFFVVGFYLFCCACCCC